MDAFKQFFDGVGIFFVLYMIGYASFLFLAVTVGTSEPVSYTHLKNFPVSWIRS